MDKQRFAKLLRKVAICAVAALVAALVLEWLQVNTQPMLDGVRDPLNLKRMLKMS